jgi:hypothetical protein
VSLIASTAKGQVVDLHRAQFHKALDCRLHPVGAVLGLADRGACNEPRCVTA